MRAADGTPVSGAREISVRGARVSEPKRARQCERPLPTLYAAVADIPGDSFAGPRLLGVRGAPKLVARSAAARDEAVARCPPPLVGIRGTHRCYKLWSTQ